MKLYHYSPVLFDILKTRRKAGVASKDEIKKAEENQQKFLLEGAYVDHLSFFFDPIPAALLPKLFGKGHRTWSKGTKLYEYVVDTTTFDSAITYRVVESLRRTVFMDTFSKENNWESDDPEILLRYLKELNKLQLKWGELGYTLQGLDAQIALNMGKTEQNYLTASKRPDFEEGKIRYASNVPHLMVYPKSGITRIEEVSSLTMGNDTRTPVQKDQHAAFRW